MDALPLTSVTRSLHGAAKQRAEELATLRETVGTVPLDVLDQVVATCDATCIAPSTRYARMLYARWFADFCQRYNLRLVPAEPTTVCLFFAELIRRGVGYGTLRGASQAIREEHRRRGVADPTADYKVKAMIRGHRRKGNGKPSRKKSGLLTPDVQVLARSLDAIGDLRALRDKAYFLLLFGGAFRAGEVLALTMEQLSMDERGLGLRVTLRHSKTNQEGRDEVVAVAWGLDYDGVCPVSTMIQWLEEMEKRGRTSGLVFPTFAMSYNAGQEPSPERLFYERPMKVQTMWKALKRRLADAGIDPERYGTHSFRIGHVNQAARNPAATFEEILQQWRWKSPAMLSVYLRGGMRLLHDNSSSRLSL